MKICLILPPSNSDVKAVVGTAPPLGLAYLASVLRSEHEVSIIDADALDYSMEDIKRILDESMPDMVGITSTTPAIYSAYEVAKIAKEVRRDCVVVIGGPHATFMASQILKECPFIDIVVKGEGERIAAELVDALAHKRSIESIRGIAFRTADGGIVENEPMPLIENLDEIPFPSRDLLPNEKYISGGVRYTTIMTSRGCPFRCIFCASSHMFGKWRARSPENVVAEIKEIVNTHHIRNILFLDDTFTLDMERAARIADEIVSNRLDIVWSASSRANTITRTLAEKMRRAGCRTIYLGIESGCQRSLDTIRKRITLEQARKAVEIVKKAGMRVVGSFIIGIPGETVECIEKTIEFAKSLDIDYAQFSVLTPYPGTPLFEVADKNGWLLTKDWSKYTSLIPVMKVPGFTSEQLAKFLRKAYMDFYLSPRVVWNQIKRRRFGFIKKGIQSAINYMRIRAHV